MNVWKLALCGVAGMIVVATTHLAAAQLKQLEFEVASIKPNAAGDHRMVTQFTPGGRLNITGAALRDLIRTAYRVADFQIVGGPAWMTSVRWDVQAEAEEKAPQNQLNEMLQSLLTDRFQLKFHKETRTGPVYGLTIARNGPKLKETDSEPTSTGHNSDSPERRQNHGGGGHTAGRSMTMADLVKMLEGIVGRNVIDKTELKGNYDIALSWAPEPGQNSAYADHAEAGRERESAPADSGLPSIFTAIQEQLGLKLQSARGPVEVLIIDSAQKP